MNEVRIINSDELGFVTNLKDGVFTVQLHKRYRASEDNGERIYTYKELHFILKDVRKRASVLSRTKRVHINFVDGKFVTGIYHKGCSVLCYKNGSEISLTL